MTAVNLAIHRKAGYLYTDTAHTEAVTGRLVAVGSKMIAGKNWAIGVSGRSGAIQAAADAINDAGPRNLTSMLRCLPDVLRASVQVEGEVHRLYLVAWDVRHRRPRGYMITTTDLDGFEPFVPVELDDCASYSGAAALLGRPCDMSSAADFDPVDDGIALMEAQRWMTWAPIDGGAAVPRCGGGLMFAKVDASGVSVEVLRTWPDEIGEIIAPEPTNRSQAQPSEDK